MTSKTNQQNLSPKIKLGLTGARGVLGQTLQLVWPEVEWNVFPDDIREIAQVQKWYSSLQNVSGIVHFAALVPTHLVEADPLRALKVNVEGTCNLLETIRRTSPAEQVPWIFLASTSHVYASSDQPVAENSRIDPISLYGLTKLQAETWGKVFQEKFKLPICTGRIFSYSSHLQPNTYFIPSMINKISHSPQNGVLEIPGLHGTRDFLTAESVCLGIKQLFEKQAMGTFNIASGRAQSLLDIVKTIQTRLNRPDVEIIAPPQGTNHLIANVSRLADFHIRLNFNLNQFLDVLLEPNVAEHIPTRELS